MALTLRRLEGFDVASTASIGSFVDLLYGAPVVATPGADGTGNHVRLSTTSMGMEWSLAPVVALGDRLIMGFAFYPETNGMNFWKAEEGSSEHGQLFLTAGGLLEARRATTAVATGSTVVTLNAWHYIEIELVVGNANGSWRIYLDGLPEVSGSSLDTQDGGTGIIQTTRIIVNPGSRALRVDDVYIGVAPAGDAAATNFVSLVGGIPKVSALLPTGAGNSTGFTPSTGSNYQNVDDAVPDDGSTYNGSAVVSTKDTFAMGNLPSSGAVIAVQQDIYAAKMDAGNRSLREVYRIGGTDYTADEVPLSTSYRYQRRLRQVSPATGTAWSDTEVNGLEAGYQIAV